MIVQIFAVSFVWLPCILDMTEAGFIDVSDIVIIIIADDKAGQGGEYR